MPIDATIPLQSKFTPADPMKLIGEFGSAANAFSQNRLLGNANQQFQAEFAAKKAVGDIARASIDPDTGRFDQVKFNKLLGASQDAAFSAPEALSTGQGIAQGGQQIDQNTMALLHQENGLTGDFVAKALATPPGQLTREGVVQSANETFLPFIKSLPANLQKLASTQLVQQVQGLPQDEQAIRDYLRGLAVQSQSKAEQIGSLYGSAVPVDRGPNVQVENVNPQTGAVAPMGAPITKGLTPEVATAPQPGSPTPEGAPTVTTRAAQAAAVAAGGPQVVGLSPARTAGAAVTGQANAQQGIDLQHRAEKVPETKAILGNMAGELDHFTPGPQSGFWRGAGQLAQEYGIPIPGAPPKDAVAAQEQFGKLAFQLAQTQFQALGGTGTDAKLDSTMHTSPSELMSRMGSKGIIALLKGNEDAVAAKAATWQKWLDSGRGPETYGQFQTQFNKIYDPRVFQFQYLDAGDQAKALKGMSPAERKTFDKARGYAKQFGWAP